jgi:hypothetical protein
MKTVLGVWGVWGVIFIGWVANILAITKIVGLTFSGYIFLQVAGVFLFPLGSVMGWIYIFS